MSKQALHIRDSGDLSGDYLLEEQLPDGRLVIRREDSYPSVIPKLSGRPATRAEFEAFLKQHGEHMLPPDGEG